MEKILANNGLQRLIPVFERERITPDIVCHLSLYDMKCLGLSSRTEIMKIRIDSIHFGHIQPFKTRCGFGPPEFQISKSSIENLLADGFKIKEIAELLSVSERTIFRRMQNFGLKKMTFTDIDDETLTSAITDISKEFPNCGEKLIRELLHVKNNIKVPRARLRHIVHLLDDGGIQKRKIGRLHRRVYHVEQPNSIWHVDTNHKLIRWNFVVAGAVDGFSRLIMYLHCVDNNKAETLLELFKNAVSQFGPPLRVRTDQGLENVRIADFMLQFVGQKSVITGKSVHNQRVERLWRDVYSGVLSFYSDLFSFMEDEGILDAMDPLHIYALHYVYMNQINEKLYLWSEAWASHTLRTVRTSPIRLWKSGIMNAGINFSSLQTGDDNSNNSVGVTIDHTRPILERLHVNVDERCKQLLRFHCPKHWTCPNFGINVYMKAVSILKEHCDT